VHYESPANSAEERTDPADERKGSIDAAEQRTDSAPPTGPAADVVIPPREITPRVSECHESVMLLQQEVSLMSTEENG